MGARTEEEEEGYIRFEDENGRSGREKQKKMED